MIRSDDVVVLVNEQNEPIGTAPKLATHTGQTPVHRGFSAFLFNARGEVLLQQRAFSKKTWPGVWSNSVCGHPMLNELSIEAAKRRFAFELGLNDVEAFEADPTYRYRAEKDGIVENEFCPIVVAFSPSQPKLNPEEVAAARWMPWIDWVTEASEHSQEYSPWCVEETERLTTNPIFLEHYKRWTGRSAS